MKLTSVGLLTLAASLAALGQLLFKIGADGNASFQEYFTTTILWGGLLYVAGTIIWIYVLSFEDLVDVYAFTALTFVFVYLGGIFYLKEEINFTALSGVALVLTGLFLIVNSSSN